MKLETWKLRIDRENLTIAESVIISIIIALKIIAVLLFNLPMFLFVVFVFFILFHNRINLTKTTKEIR